MKNLIFTLFLSVLMIGLLGCENAVPKKYAEERIRSQYDKEDKDGIYTLFLRNRTLLIKGNKFRIPEDYIQKLVKDGFSITTSWGG